MFTMRKKKEGSGWNADGNGKMEKRRRSALMASTEQDHCHHRNWSSSAAFGGHGNGQVQHRHEHRRQISRNSMLIPGSSAQSENLIHLMLGPGCFRELRRSNGNGSMYSLAIYNLICSLLVFTLRVLNNTTSNDAIASSSKENMCRKHSTAIPECPQQFPVTVLIEAPKVPLKALRIVLRACQSALAFRIRQCVLLEPDTFLGFQQRVAMDILLLDSYDFKVFLCPRPKLAKHIGLATLYDLQMLWKHDNSNKEQQKSISSAQLIGEQKFAQNHCDGNGGWSDLKKPFLTFFTLNPTFAHFPMQNGSNNSPACSLHRFMCRERTVLIELVEFDLDLVAMEGQRKAEIVKRNSSRKAKLKPEEKFEGVQQIGGLSLNGNVVEKCPGLNQHKKCASADENNNHNPLQNAPKQQNFPEEIPALTKSVQKLLGWVGEHGERQLAKLEVGLWECPGTAFTCHDGLEVEKLEADRQRLGKEIENASNEFTSCTAKMELLEKKIYTEPLGRPKELIAVHQLLQGVRSRMDCLRQGFAHLSVCLESAKGFGAKIREFHTESNQLILALCRDAEIIGSKNGMLGRQSLDADRINAEIMEILGKMAKIEKCASLATQAATQFSSHLRQKQPPNGENPPVEKQLQWVRTELAAVGERRTRCVALVGLRVGRLNQRQEILKCEQFGEQIIARFNNALKSCNAKAVEELLNCRRNGKLLLDYARQMAQLAGVLRKLNRLEPPNPGEQFGQRMECLWRMLEQKHKIYGNQK